MPNVHHHIFKIPFWKIDGNHNLRVLYGVRFLYDFVGKLAVIYVPLFLFQLDLDIPYFPQIEVFKQKMLLVLLYFLLMRLFALLTSLPASKIIASLGTRGGLLLGIALQGLYFISFDFTADYWWVLLITAFIQALSINFFWLVFHVVTTLSTTKSHMGEDLGIFSFLIQLASVVAPVGGGLIIATFGFSSVFFTALIGIVLMIGVAMMMDNRRFRSAPSLAELGLWLRERQVWVMGGAYVGKYFHEAAITLWPLYIFLLLGAIEKVGYLYSLSLFLSMIVTFMGGVYIDYSRSKKPYFVTGGLLSLLWIARTQVLSLWNIAMVDSLEKLTSSFHWLYYDSMLLKRGRGSKALAYFTYREMMISIGAVGLWLLLIGIFLVLENAWSGLFGIAAVGVLLTLLMDEHHVKKET